jgi:hypothetical protein
VDVLAIQTSTPVGEVATVTHALLMGWVGERWSAVGLAGRFDVDDSLAGRNRWCGVGEADLLDILFGIVGLSNEKWALRCGDSGAQSSEGEIVLHSCAVLIFSIEMSYVLQREREGKRKIAWARNSLPYLYYSTNSSITPHQISRAKMEVYESFRNSPNDFRYPDQ